MSEDNYRQIKHIVVIITLADTSDFNLAHY